MTECSNNITLNDLPTCDNIDNEGFIIVQGAESTCKVKISNLILGVENVDFYPELLDIISQLETLTSIVQTNSAEWNTCYTTTNTNSASWSQVDSLNLAEVGSVVESTSGEWSNTTSTVFANSALWTSAYTGMSQYSSDWNDAFATLELFPDHAETIGVVQQLSGRWDWAYMNWFDLSAHTQP